MQTRAIVRGCWIVRSRHVGEVCRYRLGVAWRVEIDRSLGVLGAHHDLRIGRNTIYELVGRNEIPHRRLGKQIRFSRAVIMRWFDSWSWQGAKERQ